MFPLFYLLGIFFLIVPTMRLPLIRLSPSDVFIFAAFGWLLLEAVLPRREKRAVIPVHVLWIPAILVLIGGSIASIQAVSPFVSLWTTVKVWFVLAPWVSMGIVMVRRGYLKHILYALVLAGGVSALVGLADQIGGFGLGAKIAMSDANFWGRWTGTFGHASTLGYFTCVAFPIAVGLLMDEWQNKRRKWLVITLLCTNLLIFVAMFYSGSVTAWLSTLTAFAAIGLFWLARAQSWMRWGAAFIGVVLLLAVGSVLLFNLVPENVEAVLDRNLGRATEVTGPGRLRLLNEALNLIDQDPFIGSGMDQTGTGGLEGEDRETSSYIHNTVISGWLNGGILTFVGLVFAYAVAILTALRGLRYGIGQQNWIVLTMSAATIAWIVFDQTQPQLSQRFTWLTISLLFGLGFGIQLFPARPESNNAVARPAIPLLNLPVHRGKAGAGK